MERDPNYLVAIRRMNQAENFKAASANLLREVETAYLRKLQDIQEIREDLSKNFRTERLDKINRLLTNISINQEGSDFTFRNNNDGEMIKPDQISSGESEAVALAVEMMHFFDNLKMDKINILLLDEPDVHLHPDLQSRLAKFITDLVDALGPDLEERVVLIAATHSTPLVCALSQSDKVAVGTKSFGTDDVVFSKVNQQIKKIAPFFGHPLSLSLSRDVMIILEGEDDERVWQQAARSPKGNIKLFPVVATSVDQLNQLESFAASLLNSLYDNPVAYSIRDGDGIYEDLQPIGPVIRFRLQCYSIENLLLTDQCLFVLGRTWEEFKELANVWLQKNKIHKDFKSIKELIDSTDRLRNTKIKTIRQLICGISRSNKPWEVVVGQAIGGIDIVNPPCGPFDIPTFIGLRAFKFLIGKES